MFKRFRIAAYSEPFNLRPEYFLSQFISITAISHWCYGHFFILLFQPATQNVSFKKLLPNIISQNVTACMQGGYFHFAAFQTFAWCSQKERFRKEKKMFKKAWWGQIGSWIYLLLKYQCESVSTCPELVERIRVSRLCVSPCLTLWLKKVLFWLFFCWHCLKLR